MSVERKLADLAVRWSEAEPAERANAQSYVIELTEALGVDRPGPRGTGYEFELPVSVVNRDGTETVQFADLFREEHFLLESKDYDPGKADDQLLRRAYGQVRSYASHVPGPLPPYLMVLDVGRSIHLWDRWTGSYGGFKAGGRIDLTKLHERPEDIALLRDVWQNPEARNPRRAANAVTQDIAVKLAELAASLEERGHNQEAVARFLIRCVFTMFAEDVGLLRDQPFLRAIRDFGLEEPEEFSRAVTDLWEAMDRGGRFGLHKLLEFDGHFFHDQEIVPLEREDLAILLEAARADWSQVEPSIMGTLLVRALDPEERHKLGAQFTPREYVERLVRPTIEEPLRERWTLVEAEVLQLRERGRKKDIKEALSRLREFHDWLREVRVLDPACGSGNFLYVAMETVKKVELEVLHTIEEITGQPEIAVEEVGPWQFLGIEVKAWSREIAELTLWIGYHQFWMAHHGHTMPPEPVLRDSGNLELRDAVLAWDEAVEDPERSRADPTPRVKHPVTGELVPDPDARLPYVEYKGAGPAEWPEADFIVGNPPYIGNKRMREAFGDGYVEALRAAYPTVPESAEYVMYWWNKAAEVVENGRTIRAGLITTNSITQTFNRSVIEAALEGPVEIVWAVPSHPWVDEVESAAIRVAMTVLARNGSGAVRIEVDDHAEVLRQIKVEHLNADLSAHADVAGATSRDLLSNNGLSNRGFTLVGRGFVLDPDEAERLMEGERRAEVIRPYRNGRDLTSRPRGVFVIDFGMRSEEEAKEYPVLYDILRDRVKPQRDANKRKSYREQWWRFGEPRTTLREALEGLDQYIATPYVSKHRFFRFLSAQTAPDEKLVCVASQDPFILAVLSSTIHAAWALAAGSRLGVGNDPTYNNSLCFDPFPFPDPPDDLRRPIAEVAERLDRHRKEALARDELVTMTSMYNVLEKLRSAEDLTEAERDIHEIAACGVLRDLHDQLDTLVANAYGWPWPMDPEEILDRLVRLHDERVVEEAEGQVRWLRPEYQVPRFAPESEEAMELKLEQEGEEAPAGPRQWPDATLDQIAAVLAELSREPGDAAEVSGRFDDAPDSLVERHLETLQIVGEVRQDEEGVFRVPAPLGEGVV